MIIAGTSIIADGGDGGGEGDVDTTIL